MFRSFGKGTIQALFRDAPEVVAHYLRLLDEEASFLSRLGGPIYRVLRKSDLEKLMTEQQHRFDIFRVHPASGKFYELVVINNNAGGPTWVVPCDLMDAKTKALIESNL
jgi:hypothetical protein